MEVVQYCAEGHQLCSIANHRHSKLVSQTPQNPKTSFIPFWILSLEAPQLQAFLF